jgi:serine/threonine-protein kinase
MEATMPDPSPAALLAFLQEHGFLTPLQVQALGGSGGVALANDRALARELVDRNWLTAYQADQLLQERGPDLVLGPYRILDRLGEGGMGQVFKAHHLTMDRVVALKLIPRDMVANPNAVGRFYREVRAVAKLSHPNIVTAFDANQVGPTHYLAMELVDGIDLARLVQQSGPLPIPQACEFIRQTAVGLQRAHEKGLVHRDIKPGNLMVARLHPDEPPIVKILDFGLARFESESDHSGRLTQLGKFIGTMDYMAPEQAQDPRTADIRADIYSLGCSLFYLLTGKPPFPGSDAVERLSARVLGDAPSVRRIRPEVSPALDQVLAKMMVRNPADRYQTPREVAQALAAFVRPRANRDAGGALPPPLQMGSPGKVTVLGGDTGELPKVRLDAAAKAPARQETGKDKTANPFEGLRESAAPPKKAKPLRRATTPPAARWYRRRPVLAGVGAALAALGLLIVYHIPWHHPAPVPAEGTIRLLLPDFADAATILLDGQQLDADKLAQPLRLSPEEHRLKVFGIGLKPLELTFPVRPGENPSVDVPVTLTHERKEGLLAEIYQGQFDVLVRTRVDPFVDASSKQPVDGGHSVWWRGFLSPPRAGIYRFYFMVDDAVSLWLDGKLLLDEWKWRGREKSRVVTYELRPQPVPIEVKYYNIDGSYGLQFLWVTPGGEQAVQVPPEAFSHDPLVATRARRAAKPEAKPPDEPRIVAEWALGLGGTVTIQPKGKGIPEKEIRPTTDLRPGTFTLKAIDLAGNVKVTDTELKTLFRQVKLKRLVLADTQMGDAGVYCCEGPQGLEELDLRSTTVTDTSLLALHRHSQLLRLDLRGTKTTAAGVERLRAKLPRCTILR